MKGKAVTVSVNVVVRVSIDVNMFPEGRPPRADPVIEGSRDSIVRNIDVYTLYQLSKPVQRFVSRPIMSCWSFFRHFNGPV
jgi:hypothetical protein